MELTRYVPVRAKLTAAVAVGAMALTLAGLHAPGAGAARLQPPACQSFTVADVQGTATGPMTFEVQTAPIPGAEAGTWAGGAPVHGAAGQTGQAERSGGASPALGAPETVSCVAEVRGTFDSTCVAIFPDATGQAGADATVSTDAETAAQSAPGAGTAQAGGTQQSVPGQVHGGTGAQTWDAGPTAVQTLDPNDPAPSTAGEQGTPGTQGVQGVPGAQVAPAGEAGTGAGGAATLQPGQPFGGTGVDDVAVSSAIPSGAVVTCGAASGAGGDTPVEVIANGTTDAIAAPGAAPADQAEQSLTGGCEEMVLSETPLPAGGSIKVSMTPC